MKALAQRSLIKIGVFHGDCYVGAAARGGGSGGFQLAGSAKRFPPGARLPHPHRAKGAGAWNCVYIDKYLMSECDGRNVTSTLWTGVDKTSI